MGRGLSAQQRKVLALAYDNHRQGSRGRMADLMHDEALLALHGWRSGRSERDPRNRRHRLPGASVKVSTGYGRRDHVAMLTRTQYDATHASVSRTVARLVQRGLLEKRDGAAYALTEQGLALCARLADAAPEGSDEQGT